MEARYGFTISFVKGASIVLIVLWGILSFAPLVDLIYDELTPYEVAIALLFAITGVASLALLYAVFAFIASPRGRRTLGTLRKDLLVKLGSFAALWLLLYSLVG